ncbi:MAP kinase kinase kinase mkh1 [Elsinoe australis]|uniref:MAP kinase kinase kinase mkh1 n=1 Tax=Elsinoe australis TaxID=40998 RepID=A0A2P7ZDW8_9PEZI|nr:MAP kinase kinase kinase mkh1 [Elsinoe australis]
MAEELLSSLAMLGKEPFHLSLFQSARSAAYNICETEDVRDLGQWHLEEQTSLISLEEKPYDRFDLVNTIQTLKSLALVFDAGTDDDPTIYMHSLTHVWARERQSLQQQTSSWVKSCCLLALVSTVIDHESTSARLLLEPHVLALLEFDIACAFVGRPRKAIVSALYQLALLLLAWNHYSELHSLVWKMLCNVQLDLSKVQAEWIPLHELNAFALQKIGQRKAAVHVYRRIVETLSKIHGPESDQLIVPLFNLGTCLDTIGCGQEAREIRERIMHRMPPQLSLSDADGKWTQQQTIKALGWSGALDRQVDEAEQLLKELCLTDGKDSLKSLWCQAELAQTYMKLARPQDALEVARKSASTARSTLADTHRARRYAEYVLAAAFWRNGDREAAMEVMNQLVELSHRAQRSSKYERRRDAMATLLAVQPFSQPGGTSSTNTRGPFTPLTPLTSANHTTTPHSTITTAGGLDPISRGKWIAQSSMATGSRAFRLNSRPQRAQLELVTTDLQPQTDPEAKAPVSTHARTALWPDKPVYATSMTSPGSPLQPDRPHHWTIERVVEWLGQNGFSQVWRDAFADLDIHAGAFLAIGRSADECKLVLHDSIVPHLRDSYAAQGIPFPSRDVGCQGIRLQRLVRALFRRPDAHLWDTLPILDVAGPD